ncbi:MAG: restriction endonuclease [Deltaproteobacteria bacterium]|nr:restriction endonuclease [Deltaproteobacteria bacterium]
MDIDALYELKPDEFERLSAEILKTEGYEVQVVGCPYDTGVDIIAQTKNHPVAVQVKHTRQLSAGTLRNIIKTLQASHYEVKEFLVITSAPLSAAAEEVVNDSSFKGISVRLLGQKDVLAALSKYPQIGEAIISPARNRFQLQRRIFLSGMIGVIASIIASLFVSGLFGLIHKQAKAPLDTRIDTVEKAIGNLKDLEQYLMDIKADMLETKQAVKAIDEEYTKAKELQKLTESQLEAVKMALRTQSWFQALINYGLGFILGVTSSLTASVIYSRWKQRRALAE